MHQHAFLRKIFALQLILYSTRQVLQACKSSRTNTDQWQRSECIIIVDRILRMNELTLSQYCDYSRVPWNRTCGPIVKWDAAGLRYLKIWWWMCIVRVWKQLRRYDEYVVRIQKLFPSACRDQMQQYDVGATIHCALHAGRSAGPENSQSLFNGEAQHVASCTGHLKFKEKHVRRRDLLWAIKRDQ